MHMFPTAFGIHLPVSGYTAYTVRKERAMNVSKQQDFFFLFTPVIKSPGNGTTQFYHLNYLITISINLIKTTFPAMPRGPTPSDF